MRKLCVIALAIVLVLGLSVAAFGQGPFPHADADWASEWSGFASNNFSVGGSILGATPGYPDLALEGYYLAGGVTVTAGALADPAWGYIRGQGTEDWAVSRLMPRIMVFENCCPTCYRTGGKTMSVWQELQQTELVCGTDYVTTYMYSAFAATGYPWIRMAQKVEMNSLEVGDFPYAMFPHVGDGLSGQFIDAYGNGPGSASMYTVVGTEAYGLYRADVLGGYFDFFGYQVVEYTDDTVNVSGEVDFYGSW